MDYFYLCKIKSRMEAGIRKDRGVSNGPESSMRFFVLKGGTMITELDIEGKDFSIELPMMADKLCTCVDALGNTIQMDDRTIDGVIAILGDCIHDIGRITEALYPKLKNQYKMVHLIYELSEKKSDDDPCWNYLESELKQMLRDEITT